MNRKSIALATVLSIAGFAVHAESPDISGQFAVTTTRAVVSTDVNQLSRAEVQADYIGNRNAVAAMTAEDSGSAFLAVRQPATAAPQLAGQPVNAQ